MLSIPHAILTFPFTLYRAQEAAVRFEKEFGISVELIDGQTLAPFDYAPLLRSLKKSGMLILANDACERGNYLHTIAGQVSQMPFDDLDAPVCVIGAFNWIVPPRQPKTNGSSRSPATPR